MVSSKLRQVTLFYKRDGTDITLFLIYVDEMIVTSSNIGEIEILHTYLAKILK